MRQSKTISKHNDGLGPAQVLPLLGLPPQPASERVKWNQKCGNSPSGQTDGLTDRQTGEPESECEAESKFEAKANNAFAHFVCVLAAPAADLWKGGSGSGSGSV